VPKAPVLFNPLIASGEAIERALGRAPKVYRPRRRPRPNCRILCEIGSWPHPDLLTVQKIFNVGPCLRDAGNTNDLSDLFVPGAIPDQITNSVR
jgi:hypothetical protein